jgi:hypothetical protein
MPYTIGKKGNKFVVRKKHGGKVMGTHSSRKKAKAQQAAIYANESISTSGDEWVKQASASPLNNVVAKIRQWNEQGLSARQALVDIRAFLPLGGLRSSVSEIFNDITIYRYDHQLDAEQTMERLKSKIYTRFGLYESFPDTPEDVAQGISISGDGWEKEGRTIFTGPAVDVVRSWNHGEISSEEATATIVDGNLGATPTQPFDRPWASPVVKIQTYITAYKNGRLNAEAFMIALKGLLFVN